MGDERRVVRFDDPVEESVLGPVALVTLIATKLQSLMRFADTTRKAPASHSEAPEGDIKLVVFTTWVRESTSNSPDAMGLYERFRRHGVAARNTREGKEVFLLMDSVPRFAMALRAVGLAAGEAHARKGYTPSVVATLPAQWRARRQRKNEEAPIT